MNDPSLVLIIAAALFAAALVWGTEMPVKAALEAPQSIMRELAIGMRYVRGHREILAVVVVVGVITLAAGIKSPLEPLFALDSLDSGATGLGLLGAAWGLGMFLGAVVASPMDRRFAPGDEAIVIERVVAAEPPAASVVARR